jgi:hypothetical protein
MRKSLSMYSDEAFAAAVRDEVRRSQGPPPLPTDPRCRPIGNAVQQAQPSGQSAKLPESAGPARGGVLRVEVQRRLDVAMQNLDRTAKDPLAATMATGPHFWGADPDEQSAQLGSAEPVSGMATAAAAVKTGKDRFEAANAAAARDPRPNIVQQGPGNASSSPPPPPPPPSGVDYTARAKEIKQAVAGGAASRRSVVAVAPAIGPKGEQVVLVAGAGEARGAIKQSDLRPGEIIVEIKRPGGHAEIEIQRYAKDQGYTLTGGIYPSDPFCSNCAVFTGSAGLMPPDAEVSLGPGKPSIPYKDLSPKDLANITANRNPRYKTHDKIR